MEDLKQDIVVDDQKNTEKKAKDKCWKKESKKYVFVMGLLGTVLPFTFYFALPALILSIMAVCFSGKCKNISGNEKAGKILGIIGIVFSCLVLIILAIVIPSFMFMMKRTIEVFSMML